MSLPGRVPPQCVFYYLTKRSGIYSYWTKNTERFTGKIWKEATFSPELPLPILPVVFLAVKQNNSDHLQGLVADIFDGVAGTAPGQYSVPGLYNPNFSIVIDFTFTLEDIVDLLFSLMPVITDGTTWLQADTGTEAGFASQLLPSEDVDHLHLTLAVPHPFPHFPDHVFPFPDHLVLLLCWVLLALC